MSGERIESMLSQLIRMVGTLQTEVQEINAVQAETNNRLLKLEDRVGSLENKVNVLDVKVDALDSKVSALEVKVDALDSKVSALDVKVDALENKVNALDVKVDALDSKVSALEVKVEALENKVDAHHKEILEQFQGVERDQDFIWEKAVQNERELANIKSKLG